MKQSPLRTSKVITLHSVIIKTGFENLLVFKISSNKINGWIETKLINLKGISVLVSKEKKSSAITGPNKHRHTFTQCSTTKYLSSIHVPQNRGRGEDKKK